MQPSFAFMDQLNSFDSRLKQIDKDLNILESSPQEKGKTDERIEAIRSRFTELTKEASTLFGAARSSAAKIDLSEVVKIQMLTGSMQEIGEHIAKLTPAGKAIDAMKKMIDDTKA